MVYQIIESELRTRGIFDDLETSKATATALHEKNKELYQINEIPLNVIGYYGQSFKIWTIGNL